MTFHLTLHNLIPDVSYGPSRINYLFRPVVVPCLVELLDSFSQLELEPLSVGNMCVHFSVLSALYKNVDWIIKKRNRLK